MKKLLWLIISAILVVLIFVKSDEYNFEVTIKFANYLVEISLLGLILALMIFFILTYQLGKFTTIIGSFPAKIKTILHDRKHNNDLEMLLKSLVAKESGNFKDAHKFLAKTSDSQLKDLIRLQISMQERDDHLSENLINQLLLDKNTKFIAYRYLTELKLSSNYYQGVYEAALQAALRAIEIAPNSQIILRYLADIYLELGVPEQSYFTYDRLPKTEEIEERLSNAALSAAKGYFRFSEPRNADIWLDRALLHKNDNIDVYLLKIDILVNANEPEKALELNLNALKLCPGERLLAKLFELSKLDTTSCLEQLTSIMKTP